MIAGRDGDALVLRNEELKQPLKVFNFSVADTESYFVGEGGSWVHNASCVLVPGGGLRAHERAGGHLIKKHVEKTEQQLRARFSREPHIKASSSFPDRMTAEYAVAEALKANSKEIDAFLSGRRRKIELLHTLPQEIGVVATIDKPGVTSSNTVLVVLVKDPKRSEGYFILTGYPTL